MFGGMCIAEMLIRAGSKSQFVIPRGPSDFYEIVCILFVRVGGKPLGHLLFIVWYSREEK